MDSFQFASIGTIQSPFHQRFGIPRQPGLAPQIESTILLNSDSRLVTAVNGLESFSHIWVVFVFHQTGREGWIPSVRPPRLGGAKKMGVLASRSPHRPNPIGLSVVELKKIEILPKQQVKLTVLGGDFLNGTPVLDLKPYLGYCDSLKKTRSGWAKEKIKKYKIVWSPQALKELKILKSSTEFAKTKKMISEVLSLDPRPAFQQRKLSDETSNYGIALEDIDIQWKFKNSAISVMSVRPLKEFKSQSKS